jgi:hypothetical protein
MSSNFQLTSNFRKRIQDSLNLTKSARRWEQLIVSFLRRLELDATHRKDAEKEYMALADRIATRLEIPRHAVDVYAQGSMRTQTTIAQRGNAKFDIDVVVELSGPLHQNPDPEILFAAFGTALEGDEELTGKPTARRRCWTLPYPNKAYYFDVTPAVPDIAGAYGGRLRVRDPHSRWTPSNPKEFAEWVCERADLQFSFRSAIGLDGLVEARKSIAPLPNDPVRIDDILRRTIQLLKLHRDNFYHFAEDTQKEAAPISVIIVTLAGNTFGELWRTRRDEFTSPIEVVLAIVEEMPKGIKCDANGKFFVTNPMLPTENFADRWNTDQGVRAREFKRWHAQLENHLEALLTDEYSASAESKLSAVFGQAGVDAWKDSLGLTAERSPLLKSLVAASGVKVSNPTVLTPVGRNTRTLA